MTTSIDWVHEIDISLDSGDPPRAAYLDTTRTLRRRRHLEPSGEAFSGYVSEHGAHVRRLAHAICCDWNQAETLAVDVLTHLYDVWHRIPSTGAADTFVYRELARARVTDSPQPRSCRARGEGYPMEDESLLFDGLQSLSVLQRKAVVLHDWLDLPAKEVGDALGISADLAASHASRGRSALNLLLSESA